MLTYALFNLEDNENILSRKHLPQRFLVQLENGKETSPGQLTGKEEARPPQTAVPKPHKKIQSMDAARNRAESDTLREALKSARYNKSLAAQMLGISRNKLYRKLKKLGLADSNGEYIEEES